MECGQWKLARRPPVHLHPGSMGNLGPVMQGQCTRRLALMSRSSSSRV